MERLDDQAGCGEVALPWIRLEPPHNNATELVHSHVFWCAITGHFTKRMGDGPVRVRNASDVAVAEEPEARIFLLAFVEQRVARFEVSTLYGGFVRLCWR